jgi:hypothetical protein
MVKVKAFNNDYADGLANQVNGWLVSTGFELIDIKYASSIDSRDRSRLTALVIYKDNDEDDEPIRMVK